jgi:excisionase family DNA binding protein
MIASEITPETSTVAVAYRRLGLTRAGTYAAIKSGEIPSLRIGRSIRISNRWIDRQLAKAAGEQPSP